MGTVQAERASGVVRLREHGSEGGHRVHRPQQGLPERSVPPSGPILRPSRGPHGRPKAPVPTAPPIRARMRPRLPALSTGDPCGAAERCSLERPPECPPTATASRRVLHGRRGRRVVPERANPQGARPFRARLPRLRFPGHQGAPRARHRFLLPWLASFHSPPRAQRAPAEHAPAAPVVPLPPPRPERAQPLTFPPPLPHSRSPAIRTSTSSSSARTPRGSMPASSTRSSPASSSPSRRAILSPPLSPLSRAALLGRRLCIPTRLRPRRAARHLQHSSSHNPL